MQRWRALFEAHDVEWGNAWKVLSRLADVHVPGFKMQGRSGSKVIWDDVTKADLHIAI